MFLSKEELLTPYIVLGLVRPLIEYYNWPDPLYSINRISRNVLDNIIKIYICLLLLDNKFLIEIYILSSWYFLRGDYSI